jgi:hypothetical protein
VSTTTTDEAVRELASKPSGSDPTGYLHPGPYAFSPEGVRIGFVIDG